METAYPVTPVLLCRTLLLLLCVFCNPASAQELSVFDLDASGYPTIKGKFFALDSNGLPIRGLTPGDFRVTENGTTTKVTLVSCPDIKPAEPASVAISIDVSASMKRGKGEMSPLDLAKLSATNLTNALSLPPSEMALQTCDDYPYIYQDFTTDASKIMGSIQAVSIGGNNDFVAQLLDPRTGLLNIAKSGANRRAAILLTDAYWGPLTSSELQRCIDTCVKYDIHFYAVIYTRPEVQPNGIKASLRQLAAATGGKLIDGVLTIEESAELAYELQRIVQGIEPCRIEWLSLPSCTPERTALVEIPREPLSDIARYTVTASDSASSARLEVSPMSIAFGAVAPGTTRDTTVTLTAHNAPVTVRAITGNSARFAITGNVAPPAFTLAPGESRTITLHFAPVDSAMAFGEFAFESNACVSDRLYASGGFYRHNASQLKLTSPNGGERFTPGEIAEITWTGVLPEEPVRLEYSIDEGATWTTITTNATGLRQPWLVPPRYSERCLMRVTQTPSDDAVMVLDGHANSVVDVDLSPDGRYALTVSYDEFVRVWDTYTGKVLKAYPQPFVKSARFSPDGRLFVMTGDDGTARVWNWVTGSLVSTMVTGNYNRINAAAFSPNGGTIATAGLRTVNIPTNSPSGVLWDVTTGAFQKTLAPADPMYGYGETIDVDYSPDGSRIVSGGTYFPGDLVGINDAMSGARIRSLAHGGDVRSVRYSRDGKKIMTAGDGRVKLWNESDGKLMLTLTFINSVAADLAPDAQVVAVANEKEAALWELAGSSVIRFFKGHKDRVVSIRFSADGRRLITGSEDHTARIWDLDASPLQSDVSDSLWAIVGSRPASQDVDMGRVLVGSFRDSSVISFVRNTGSVPVQVKDIRIIGANASDFTIISGQPPFVVDPGSERAVEFRFTPTAIGLRSATVDIITKDSTLHQSIRGEGVEPVIKVETDLVDFGKVGIGKFRDTILTVAIRNIGTRALNINRTFQLGPDTTQFMVLSGGGSFTLAPGSSHSLQLRFAPRSLGRSSGRVAFDYGDVGSPAVVRLYGEGVIVGSQPVLEAASVLAFPAANCANPSQEKIVEIHNAGTAPLEVSAVEITGANAGDFVLAQPFTSLSIPPAGDDLLRVRFVPKGRGERIASLLLHSNSAGMPEFPIALSGRSDSIAIEPSLREIDFGVICPGQSIDTTFVLANTGTTMTGVSGSIASDFSLPVTAWRLDSGRSGSVSVRFPGVDVEGVYTGRLTFTDSICGSVVTIPIEVEVVAPRIVVSPLGVTTPQGSYIDTMLTITNPSTRDLSITDAQSGDPQFAIIGNPFPLIVPAGMSGKIPLRYVPAGTSAVTTTLDLVGEPCDLSESIRLDGDVTPAIAVLALPFVEAAPGDTIEVPVMLRGAGNISGSKVTGFATTLRFNAMLLLPVGSTPAGTMDSSNNRLIPLLLPSVPLKDSTLTTLRFVALLGDDTTTALLLEGSSGIGGEIIVEELPGRFTIAGICGRGRNRLFTLYGATALKQNAPNPVTSSTAIDFEVPEQEHVRLFITDMYGRTVADLVDGEVSAGEHSVRLDASSLSSGVYYYTLQTPWRSISRVLIVRK